MSVYMIFNVLNNKIYIGITKHPIRRWKEHQKRAKAKSIKTKRQAIHLAIAKHGAENFIFKVVELLPNLETANLREKDWIKELKILGVKLYNQTEGGDGSKGHTWNPESKQKRSQEMSGDKNHMYGIKLYGNANGNYGKGLKPHVRDILIKTNRKLNDEQIKNIKDLHISGKKQTELAKEYNVSLTTIHRVINDKIYGKHGHDAVLGKKHITPENVRDIRRKYENENLSYEDLGKEFNMSRDHIGAIVSRRKWKHID